MNDASIVFLPHGGGPLPLLGEPGHAELVSSLQLLSADKPMPKAIVVISAHWEAPVATLSSHPAPPMIYDYSGFPQAAYELDYRAPGEPALASQLSDLLRQHGIAVAEDAERGFDHGTFVPLMLMYPRADIPVVQLSLLSSLDARACIDIGRAIAPILDHEVLVLGSGMSFHNMTAFMQGGPEVLPRSIAFDDWLHELLVDSRLSADQRAERLGDWQSAPHARYCHPREEHLLPVHVCFGAAVARGLDARCFFRDELLGARVSGYAWS